MSDLRVRIDCPPAKYHGRTGTVRSLAIELDPVEGEAPVITGASVDAVEWQGEPPLSAVLRMIEQRTVEALHGQVTRAELAADTARVALSDLSVAYAQKAVELRDMTEANAKNSAELHLVNRLLEAAQAELLVLRESEFHKGLLL